MYYPGTASIEALRAGRKRQAENELYKDELESDNDEETPRENGTMVQHSSTVNYISDSHNTGPRRFSLTAPKLLTSASFTIESRTSGAASIAQSGFGTAIPSAKRIALDGESVEQDSQESGSSSAEMTDKCKLTTANRPITTDSDPRRIRGLTPISPFAQCLSGKTSPLDKRFSPSEGSTFVFGQDMSGRVTNAPSFTTSLQTTAEETRRRDGASPSEKRASWSTSGSDGSVAAIVPSPSVVKIPEKVDLKTGEENDKNVLQVHCNLHVFDSKTQSWSERGRGLLRLNDMEHPNDDGTFQSRLVMRTDGSLRLVLNTLLWPQMICEKASQRSLRITALDTSDQGIRVFLITCAAKDVQPLHNAIDGRISALKRRHAVLTAQASAVEDPGDESDKCDQHNHDDTSDLSEADSEIMRSDHIRQERMKAVTSVKKGE